MKDEKSRPILIMGAVIFLAAAALLTLELAG
jgi:hypothetical protein